MKKILSITGLAVLLVAFMPSFTGALYEFGEGEAVGTRVEVSKNGTDWYNFYANENPGGQTLYVSPGDNLTFKGISWNAGLSNLDVEFEAILTGTDYFADFDVFGDGADDLDGNTNDYIAGLETITDADNGTASFPVTLASGLPLVSDDASPEEGSITVTLADDIPDGTVIMGIFQVTAAEVQQQIINFGTFGKYGRVFAQEPGESTVRIVVQNATDDEETVLPKTGAHR
ncbi:MAG: hypothetical protein PHW75_01455 [Patescibacteria group bacterium]|nr:hypothetical protein [Patescibacteria group bacterium]